VGKIDQSVKAYVKIPGIFTQLFNETFFDREHYIHPEDVSEQDSVTDVPLKGREMAERIRDVCMLSKSGMGFRIILGVEEQTDIHYYMPVRVMQLDAMHYEKQCRMKAADARQQGIQFPPVHGVPRGTVICPVMTVVLYVGEDRWDGPRELYDMYGLKEEEKKWLKQYVPNYPMHLIDARHMSEKELSRFTGDLKIFFTAMREDCNEEMMKGMVAKYPDTWYTLAVVKNDKRYSSYARTVTGSKDEENGGGIAVDKWLDKVEERGFRRGISQGISQGLSQGIDMITELYKRMASEGRQEDIKRSFEDAVYQRGLLQEYGLTEEGV